MPPDEQSTTSTPRSFSSRASAICVSRSCQAPPLPSTQDVSEEQRAVFRPGFALTASITYEAEPHAAGEIAAIAVCCAGW